MTYSTKRIWQFSYLRVFACIAIIVLHTVFAANIYFLNDIGISQNTCSRAIENCMMWAVPSFLMVTGALLLDPKKEISLKKLFSKYIFRVVIALLMFCMIFRIFDIIMDHEQISANSVLQGFYEFLQGDSWGHLWYLYLLIGLYLLLPFYRKIAQFCTNVELKYLILVYVVFLSLLPILNLWNINCGFYICSALIYPLYLFGGHIIHEKKFNIHFGVAAAMVIISTILIIVVTSIRWRTSLEVLDFFYGYSSILVIVQTIGIFAIIDKMPCEKHMRLNKIVQVFDNCSFGIYLIHMIFVRWLLRYMGINPYEEGGVIGFFIIIIGIFAVSFCITWALKKIPGINKVL